MKDIVSAEKYSQILELQKRINLELQELFEQNKTKGRKELASLLVNNVETIVEQLNKEGNTFVRCDYSGDKYFENSEQTYSDGKDMGTGVIIHFYGFSAQVYWEGSDKYYSPSK